MFRTGKIACHKTIFICTSNVGDKQIEDFATTHHERVHKKMTKADIAWVQKELCQKILNEQVERFFVSVDKDLRPLLSRINVIVPFLPFTGDIVLGFELRMCSVCVLQGRTVHSACLLKP